MYRKVGPGQAHKALERSGSIRWYGSSRCFGKSRTEPAPNLRMLLFKEQIEAALDLCGYRAAREKDTWQCPVDGHNNDDIRPSLFVGEDSSGFAIIRCRSQGHTSRDVIMA